jgi:hypothetical protein
MSLNDHCVSIKKEHGIEIQKQSLDERFNQGAVSFVKELLEEQLSNQIHCVLESEKLTHLLKPFSSVNIKDSTRFQINANHQEYYPGSKGNATGAGIHIQFEFDIKTGKVKDLNVTDALQQDSSDACNTVDAIEKNSLTIRDLGYFSTFVLEEISKREAFYITRPSFTLSIYRTQNDEKINFAALHKMMKRKKLSSLDLNVFLGRNRLPARIIIEMIPPSCLERRLAKLKDTARRKGFQYSDEYLAQSQLNIFITNIPAELVCSNDLRKLYQLRWQIELRFKAWKSFYHLEIIKKMKRHRFECYLYSTLLLIMINWEIATNFFAILWNHTGRTLSILKFYKTTSKYLSDLRNAIFKAKQKLISYLFFLYEISHEKLLIEKRKGHRGLEEILLTV